MVVKAIVQKKSFWKKVCHKLFECPTFWRVKPSFRCPKCGKSYRCYWDGNDVKGVGVDLCNKCAAVYEVSFNDVKAERNYG